MKVIVTACNTKFHQRLPNYTHPPYYVRVLIGAGVIHTCRSHLQRQLHMSEIILVDIGASAKDFTYSLKAGIKLRARKLLREIYQGNHCADTTLSQSRTLNPRSLCLVLVTSRL